MGIQNVKQRYLNAFDLLVLGLGPIFLFGLVAYTLLGFLPAPANYVVMVILVLAALPLAFHVLRQYAVRYGKK